MIINIRNDFSKYPGGRYKSDGPFSAEALRDDILVPALKENPDTTITLEMDGVLGYGSSFLEECFGGLIRERGFTYEELKRRLKFETSTSFLVPNIDRFMEAANG